MSWDAKPTTQTRSRRPTSNSPRSRKRRKSSNCSPCLMGPNDPLNCFFVIQAGAGGTEAQDWSEMLLRMYLYFFERRGWDVSEVDRQYGEQAGIKNVMLHVKGAYAFGYLRAEAGVHRLVRPSPFNAQGKRQTSFAIRQCRPRIRRRRTRWRNPRKRSRHRRLRPSLRPRRAERQQGRLRRPHHAQTHRHHVTCSVERSQQQNKRLAMAIIRSQDRSIRASQARRRAAPSRRRPKAVSFGYQIRSYVLDDRRVKDHRTNVETHDVESVLDRGELDRFHRRRAAPQKGGEEVNIVNRVNLHPAHSLASLRM